jgi:hypothetical protein
VHFVALVSGESVTDKARNKHMKFARGILSTRAAALIGILRKIKLNV